MRSQRVSSAVRGGLPSSITLALAFSLVLPALISTAPAGAEPNTLAGRQAFRAMVASTEKLRREGKLDEAVGACEAFLRAHPDAGMLTTMAVGRIGHILRGPEAKELRAKLAAGIPVEFPDCLPYVCLSGAWRAQDMLWGTAATEASVQEAERLLSGLIDELGARFPVHDSPGRQVLALRVQALRRQDRLDEALTCARAYVARAPGLLSDRFILQALHDCVSVRNTTGELVQCAKLYYVLCHFTEPEVNHAVKLASKALTLHGGPGEALQFLRAQEEAGAPNPLSRLPLFAVADVTTMATAAQENPEAKLNVLLFSGRFDEALDMAMEQMRRAAARDPGLMATALRNVARCMKAHDLNVIRANQFLEFHRTGIGENPIYEFQEQIAQIETPAEGGG